MKEDIIDLKNKRISVQQVARALGKSDEFVRVGLQRGLLPFGTAYKLPGRKKYSYLVNFEKFVKYVRNGEM